MKIKTKGLVLKINDTAASDKLLILLCENIGRINVFFKGFKSNGKKGSVPDLFCYGEFVLFLSQNSNYTLESFTPIEPFYNIREDILSLSAAAYFSNVLMYVTASDSEYTNLYLSLGLNSLFLLTRKDDILKIKSAFELKIMQYLGFCPSLEGKTGENKTYFCIEDGSIHPNIINNSLLITPSALKAVIHILEKKPNKIFSFNIDKSDMKNLYQISQNYFIYHIERNFNSLDMLNKLLENEN